MAYLFLLPLLIAVVTGYFCRNSRDEIAYLMTLAAMGSLLLSLILAPWQIQLLLSIALVTIGTIVWQQWDRSGREAIEGTVLENTEKETGPDIEIEGKYRGVPLKMNPHPSIAAPIRPSALKYRGASPIEKTKNS